MDLFVVGGLFKVALLHAITFCVIVEILHVLSVHKVLLLYIVYIRASGIR